MRFLVLSPRPGDGVLGAGGAVARLCVAGHDVALVTVFGDAIDADRRAAAHLRIGEVRGLGCGDGETAEALAPALAQLGCFDALLAPMGLGEQRTHRELLRALGVPALVIDGPPLRTRPPGSVVLFRDLPSAAGERPPGGDALQPVPLPYDALAAKLAAAAEYGDGVPGAEEIRAFALAEGRGFDLDGPAEVVANVPPLLRALDALPDAPWSLR